MIVRPCDDPILKRFRAVLDQMYGDRIERVVLYGSRARGDARADSDYDIAVFIKTRAPFLSSCTGSHPSARIFCSTLAR